LINYADLAARLAGKHVRREEDLPFAYRKGQRPLHDDWSIWPFTRIPRAWTWYRMPMPFKCLEANYAPRWMPWQEGYPEAPEAQFRDAAPGALVWSSEKVGYIQLAREVLAYDPVPAVGGRAKFAVWLDGKWRECYHTSTVIMQIPLVGLRRVHRNGILKFDITHGDFGCQFPDASFSLQKVAA
jgi:hypothetical protein